jgi:L-aminopeptidase/D-esterase-like protein
MSRELRFDFPGLRIGVAEYEEGPTGCTVFHLPPGGAACAIDVRGGSPGTIGNYEWAHAICFAGGSLYGLEAACGVAAELLAARGNTVGWTDIEVVPGAIIFDFGRRENAIYPDRELGRAALRAARPGVFPLVARLEAEMPRAAPGNTTLTLVVTNQSLDRRSLRQLAAQVHASMARAIQPFHVLVDGDVLYAVTTGEVDNPELTDTALGVVASELAWDAVLSCFDD